MSGEQFLFERMIHADTCSKDRHETADQLREQGDIERAALHTKIARRWTDIADAIEGELMYGEVV